MVENVENEIQIEATGPDFVVRYCVPKISDVLDPYLVLKFSPRK